jgi:hypothetical protein
MKSPALKKGAIKAHFEKRRQSKPPFEKGAIKAPLKKEAIKAPL